MQNEVVDHNVNKTNKQERTTTKKNNCSLPNHSPRFTDITCNKLEPVTCTDLGF